MLRQGRRWLAMGLLLGGSVAGFGEGSKSCKVDHAPPSEADNAMAAREYPKAEQLYEAMWKEKPGETAALAGVIRAKMAQGNMDDALLLAKQGAKDHPKDARLADAVGEAEMRRGEPELAVEAFNEALRDDIWRCANAPTMSPATTT